MTNRTWYVIRLHTGMYVCYIAGNGARVCTQLRNAQRFPSMTAATIAAFQLPETLRHHEKEISTATNTIEPHSDEEIE